MARHRERLAGLSDIPAAGLLSVVSAAGERICLVRLPGNELRALRDCCSHQQFLLSEGIVLPTGELECAWHGARFDCTSGAATHFPATDPVPTYDVIVEDGDVYLLTGPST